MNLNKPQEEIKIEKEVSNIELRKQLNKIPECPKNPKDIYITDKIYKIPDSPKDIIDMVHSSYWRYIPNERDCDDFVRIFRGILSIWGYGNLLAMQCCIKKSGDKVPHELIAFLKDEELVFGEPQTGLLTRVPSGTRVLKLIV